MPARHTEETVSLILSKNSKHVVPVSQKFKFVVAVLFMQLIFWFIVFFKKSQVMLFTELHFCHINCLKPELSNNSFFFNSTFIEPPDFKKKIYRLTYK